jgi:ABC-type nitrate/sulfonate/bicarbonate transport system substrate-binding protein
MLKQSWALIKGLALAIFVTFTGLGVVAEAAPTQLLVGQTFVNAVPTGFWIAMEQGFFKKYDLDVKIVHFRGNPIGTQALLTGSIPILMAGPHSAVAAKAGGADLVEFATVAPAMPYLIVTRKEIKSPEELKGKMFGVSGTGLSASYIGAIIGLRHLGLDVKRDKIVLIATGNETDRHIALTQGMLAGSVFDRLYKPAIQKDGFPIIADLGALGIPWEHDVLLSTGKFLKEQPKTVENLLKGLIEANAFILNPANKETVKKTIVKNLGPKMGDGSAAYDQITSLWIKTRPYPNKKGIQSIIDEVKLINPAVAKLNIDDFVDDTILKRIDQSGFIDNLKVGNQRLSLNAN